MKGSLIFVKWIILNNLGFLMIDKLSIIWKRYLRRRIESISYFLFASNISDLSQMLFESTFTTRNCAKNGFISEVFKCLDFYLTPTRFIFETS